MVAVVVVALLAFGAVRDPGPRTSADRVRAIGETVRCPQCTGQSVADSDATIAREMRAEIARRVDEGQTDATIQAFFATTYGEDVLLTPPSDGVASLVWVLPVVVAVGGAAIVITTIRRRGDEPDEPSEADRALVELLREERRTGGASATAATSPDDA